MLQIRPLYRAAVRNATGYQCAACVSQRRPQRQLHATPRMRQDRLPALASKEDNAHASSGTGDAKHGPADHGGEASVHTTAESGSLSRESTTTHESPATTTTTTMMIEAPAAALGPLTTLARPWTPIAGKPPQEAAGGSTSTGTTTTSIDKTFRFDTFEDAFMFMTRIAFYASQVNHHPRMFNFWNRVRLTLSSYDSVRKTRVVSLADVEMGVFAEKVYASVVDRRRNGDERGGASVGPDEGADNDDNGRTTKLSDILAEELIRRGSDSYAMLNSTPRQGQTRPEKSQNHKKATLDAMKSIKRKDKKKE
ncbi:hypothetical protein V1507DRAFT_447241 [Lipomyces tetrasporus]